MDKISRTQLISCEIKADWYRLLHKIAGHKIKRSRYGNNYVLSVGEGRKKLIEAINKGKPYMASRFGTSEGTTLFEYRKIGGGLQRCYSEKSRGYMLNNAGFFPNDDEHLNLWAEETLRYCKNMDMLGVQYFRGEEFFVKNYCPRNIILLPVGGLGSAKNGWAHCLEGKKVLVVHPFTETIKKQYARREEIFPGTNALPRFDLKTVKSVVSFAGQTDSRFKTWFEARDYMIEEIDKQDYDVALIGCGAYGLHLAAHVKQQGKTAVHMGGSLQTLFGIKGKRWDSDPYMRSLYNDSWVYPDESEKPKDFKSVEGGCYW